MKSNARFRSAEGRRRRGRRARGVNNFVLYAVLGALAFGALQPVSAQQRATPTAKTRGRAPAGGAARAEAPAAAAKADAGSFKAFLARARRQQQQGKFDLSRPREITVEADRTEEGALANLVVTGEAAGNANFRRLAEDFVATVNASGALRQLKDISRVRMTFALDGERFRLDSASDAPTEARAEEMARGYRAMVNFGRIAKRGTDTGALLNSMKISSSGKRLVMTLDMPREQMGNILLRQITPN